jgi:hypothetical protein
MPDPRTPDAILIDGQPFALDRLPDSPMLTASLPAFREAYPSVPESKWAESDQFEVFGPPVLRQQQSGCTGHAACSAFWLAWVAAGFDPEDFSPTWVYGLINGGHDRGAMIGDVLPALQQFGICLASTFPETSCFAPPFGHPAYAEAANYRLDDGYAISTWDELGTAIHKGFQVVSSVMVGNDFTRMDGDGFVPVDPGPGNHACASGGVRRLHGRTGIRTLTSWGPNVMDRGKFFISRDHVESQAYFSGVVFRTVVPPPGFTIPIGKVPS